MLTIYTIFITLFNFDEFEKGGVQYIFYTVRFNMNNKKTNIAICFLSPLVLMAIIMMVEFAISNIWLYMFGTLSLILLIPVIFNKLCDKRSIKICKKYGIIYITIVGLLINLFINYTLKTEKFLLAFKNQINNSDITIQETNLINNIVIILIMVSIYYFTNKNKE